MPFLPDTSPWDFPNLPSGTGGRRYEDNLNVVHYRFSVLICNTLILCKILQVDDVAPLSTGSWDYENYKGPQSVDALLSTASELRPVKLQVVGSDSDIAKELKQESMDAMLNMMG